MQLLDISFIETFCNNLVKDILKPLLTYSCHVSVDDCENISTLKIEYSIKCHKIDFSSLTKNIIHVFSFLNNFFSFQNDSQFIESVGEKISNKFLTEFFEEHLIKKIPLKRSAICEYELALKETQELIVVLRHKNFLKGDNDLVKEYCSDAQIVFEQKISVRYKAAAVSYIREDLQNTIKIESLLLNFSMPKYNYISSLQLESDYWDLILSFMNNDNRRQCFPECQISLSMLEIVNLVKNCLEEAALNNPETSAIFYNTAQVILHEYLKSPDVHRNLLNLIPQQSALVFTNTLYLLMKLVEFGKEFNQDELFSDIIGNLQHMAFTELDSQIHSQEEIILSSLKSSGLQDLSEFEILPKSVEKAIHQCLRQLLLLKNVWMNILPQDIYCFVIGRLLDKSINVIIEFIMSASYIREDVANDLVNLFTIINEKAPQVLPESREVHRFVSSWFKLRELGLVLAGSLADITERWAGGSGPLAHEMTSTQVKSLIIALFQTSDKRQLTLLSIK